MITHELGASGKLTPTVFLVLSTSAGEHLQVEPRLRALGHAVVRVSRAAEACAELRSRHVAAVLWLVGSAVEEPLDEVCQVARRNALAPTPVVVIATAEALDAAAVERAYAQGAADVLVVPRDEAAVQSKLDLLAAQFQVVDSLLREREQRRQLEDELRERNHLLALDAEVGVALGSHERLGGALKVCAEALVLHLDAAFARIWTVNEAGDALELQASAGQYTHLDGPHGRVPVGAFKIGEIAEKRRPHLTNHVLGDPRVGDQAWALREGMVAFAGYPLLVGDKLMGVVAAFARHPFSDTVLSTLESIAGGLAQGIERRWVEEQVRVNATWFSTTLTSIGDGVIATDATGRVTFLNPVAGELTGWTTEEASGRPITEVFPIFNEHTGAVVESPVDRVLREGIVVALARDTLLRQRSGATIAIEDSAAPILDVRGRLTGVILVFRDGSENRRHNAERAYLLNEERQARGEADAAWRHLHGIFMQAPAAVCILRGPSHRFELANPLYLDLVGREDVVGLTVAEALPELAGQGILELLDRVYTTGEAFRGNGVPVQLARKGTGELEARVFNFVYEPYRHASGEVAGIFVIAFDVTESTWARQGLEEANQRSQFLLRAAEGLSRGLHLETMCQELAELIVREMADLCTLVHVSPGGELRRLGAAPSSLSTPGQEPPLPSNVSEYPPWHPVRVTLSTGQRWSTEDSYAFLNEQGPEERYSAPIRQVGTRRILCLPLTAGGRTLGVLSVAMIDSDRRFGPEQIQMFESLARQTGLTIDNMALYTAAQHERARAEEANKAKDEFIATVSHELRAPLTAMLGWTQMLQTEEPGSPIFAQGLSTIERNARAQSQLIEDLLDVSRIDVGKLTIQPVLVSVPGLINAALDSARPSLSAKHLRLESSVDADVGSLVADPDRLHQVIWNLLTNAMKFTPEGGVIYVAAQRESSQIEIRVSDTGKGISPEFLPHVFERFHQAGQSTRKTGLGLGLAIVQTIVELHGGTVVAESEGLGKGATFIVRLPIRVTFDAAASFTVSTSEEQLVVPPNVLAGIRLLVVDDEPDARSLLAALLGRAGAAVRTAGSASEALALLDAEVPDALVSDIGMPGMDGYALARTLRARDVSQGGRIPAIALTAFSRSEDRTRALTAGFSAHIPKPVEPFELIVVLANALGRDLGDLLG